MADMIDIRIDATQLKSAQQLLDRFGASAKSAIVRALNRSIDGVRTDAAKYARQAYNVTATEVRKAFSLTRARAGVLQSIALAKGKRIPLIAFGALPKGPSHRKPPKVGFSAAIIPGSRKVYPGTFAAIVTGKGESGRSRAHLFMRRTDDRFPIRVQTGPAVPQMLNNAEVRQQIQENAVERFEKNFEHEVDYLFSKMGIR